VNTSWCRAVVASGLAAWLAGAASPLAAQGVNRVGDRGAPQPAQQRPDQPDYFPATIEGLTELFEQLEYEVQAFDVSGVPGLVCNPPTGCPRLVFLNDTGPVAATIVLPLREGVSARKALEAVNEANTSAWIAHYAYEPDAAQVWVSYAVPIMPYGIDMFVLAVFDRMVTGDIEQALDGPLKGLVLDDGAQR